MSRREIRMDRHPWTRGYLVEDKTSPTGWTWCPSLDRARELRRALGKREKCLKHPSGNA